MPGYVYILCTARNGVLYIGVTNNLVRRIHEHREGLADGFTKRHGIKTLVYFEQHQTVPLAIAREKALKRWYRDWKLRLIEEHNPDWRDLWDDIARL